MRACPTDHVGFGHLVAVAQAKEWSFTISPNLLSANYHLSLTWDFWSHLTLLPPIYCTHFIVLRTSAYDPLNITFAPLLLSSSCHTIFYNSSYNLRNRIMGEPSSSASYIHMVQHLIEKCLIFHMTKEECMEALSKHANIKPVITSTVWSELEKENKEFFEAYDKSKSKDDRMSEEETNRMIQKMISDSSKGASND
ncbi:hypothetical protein RIF29_14151 [Crotalaria pallida]|uniref:Uncharacterized protein n=1 Tax=Crotalaria pallida TaxID=3830 RepID=A0AAN9FGE1_CROPI